MNRLLGWGGTLILIRTGNAVSTWGCSLEYKVRTKRKQSVCTSGCKALKNTLGQLTKFDSG